MAILRNAIRAYKATAISDDGLAFKRILAQRIFLTVID
jgi:hypothetical protein